MKFAVIAAGEGSRLTGEGVETPKPLVEVCGEALIDRLLRIFSRCGATELVVICNDHSSLVAEHLRRLVVRGLDGSVVPLNLVVRSTPSSMHSFHALSEVLPAGKFCLTTVDTVFREDDFARYIAAFEADTTHDGMWAVTPFIDDEKPLYVDVDEHMDIKAFCDKHIEGARFVSGGIYAMTDKAFAVLNDCMSRGVARMRNFQRALLDAQFHLAAYSIDKIVDVDHAADIATAEQFLTHHSL